MRNSSLVKWLCAENVTGLKSVTEAADFRKEMVGERSVGIEAIPEGVVERTEVRMPV